MSKAKMRIYILTTVIAVISCTPLNKDASDAIVFDSESIYSGNDDVNAKVTNTAAEKLRQSKETGFDVGFSGLDFEKENDNTQAVSSGVDAGFDAARPGFSQGAPKSDGIQPGFSQSVDSGFDEARPGFSTSIPGTHDPQPQFTQAVDSGFHGTRPGFSEIYPSFASSRPRYGGTYPGYGNIQHGVIFPATYPSFEAPYNPSYDDKPAISTGIDEIRPWFTQRYPRQVNNRRGNQYSQTVGPDFDSGFDGTRFKQNQRPSFDAGFDGSRLGFGQNTRPSIDSGFDATRPGFNQNLRPSFDAGFDGTRPGFSQSSRPSFDAGFDGTRPGFNQNSRPLFDAGFDATRPGFGQNSRPSFDAGFDGTRPGFNQNLRPSFDVGFDGTRPGFNQNSKPSFDAGFDGTRPGFVKRYAKELPSGVDEAKQQPLHNSELKRLRRESNSDLVESIVLPQDASAYQDQQKSQKFYFLEPHLKNYPFLSNWNNQQPGNYHPYNGQGQFNNIGPYGPTGYPTGNGGTNYWTR